MFLPLKMSMVMTMKMVITEMMRMMTTWWVDGWRALPPKDDGDDDNRDVHDGSDVDYHDDDDSDDGGDCDDHDSNNGDDYGDDGDHYDDDDDNNGGELMAEELSLSGYR